MPRKPARPRLRPVRARTEDQELAIILSALSDEEVVCRSGRHEWALDGVMPGQAWPDVVRAWPGHLGVFRVEDPCLRCGLAWRVMDTLPGGELDSDYDFSYRYDPAWVKIPQQYSHGKKRIRKEKYQRGGKQAGGQARAAAARTTAADRHREREREQDRQPPQAMFSGAS